MHLVRILTAISFKALEEGAKPALLQKLESAKKTIAMKENAALKKRVKEPLKIIAETAGAAQALRQREEGKLKGE